jgi:uncharacterized membrane protein YkvA (DUF1232 family)
MISQLPSVLGLVWRLMRDPRVSRVDRALFALVLGYILTPADLLPDIVLMLGLVDDLYLAGLALSRLLGRAGPDILLEHWRGDPESLGWFVGSVEELGGLLPGPIRRALRRTVVKRRSVA